MAHSKKQLQLFEIGNTYVGEQDRFVVSVVIGYSESDGVTSPLEALQAGIRLIEGEGSEDTHFYVYDRKTKQLQLFERSDAEDGHGII